MSIQDYRDRWCERILARANPGKGFPPDLIASTYRRLLSLERAGSLAELGRVNGNGLEALKDDRAGQHAIRVNAQWRICFVWTEAGPTRV